jgi:hypothetical protein
MFYGVYHAIGISGAEPLREKLLQETMLTLEATKKICTVAESTSKQPKLMKSEKSHDDVVEMVKFSKNPSPRAHSSEQRDRSIFCRRCGERHLKYKCKEFYSICKKCGIKGHVQKMCQTGQGGGKVCVVKESVDSEEKGDEEYFRINVIPNLTFFFTDCNLRWSLKIVQTI